MPKIVVPALYLISCFFAFCITSEFSDQTNAAYNKPDDDPEEESDRSGVQLYSHDGISEIIVSNALQTNNAPINLPQSSLNAVECYSCVNCPEVLTNTTKKLCPLAVGGMKQSTCVVFAEQYRHLKKKFYIRGCASERGSCADVEQAHRNNGIVHLQFCDECEGDKCNTSGAFRSYSDITTSLITVIIFPLFLKKLL